MEQKKKKWRPEHFPAFYVEHLRSFQNFEYIFYFDIYSVCDSNVTSAQLSFEEYKFFAHTYMCAPHYLNPVRLVSGRRKKPIVILLDILLRRNYL